MALVLAITNKSGVTANYHRIISATQVYENSQLGIHINLAGYVNKAYRALEQLPTDDPNYVSQTVVANTPVFLPFSDTTPALTRAALYTRMKVEIVPMTAATDDL